MPGTPVPETAIDENGNAFPTEGEVRFPKMQLPPPPAGDSMRPKKFRKSELGVLIAVAANAGHDLRTFLYGENIGHCKGYLVITNLVSQFQ